MARILISEPHRDVQRLLERMLVRLGHEPVVIEMPDAEQLARADALIVEPLDPVGGVLAQAASIANPSLPLICASVTPPGPEFAELGVLFRACVIKPFTSKQLETAIDLALPAPPATGHTPHAEDRQPPSTELALHASSGQASANGLSTQGAPDVAAGELPEAPTAARRRILLVDDDQEIRAAVRASLEQGGGWLVIPVESGDAALDCLVAAGPLDAVLLDVTMPGLGGPATLDALHECGLPEEVPIIFLTTNAQDRERQALIFLGGIGAIAKPVDPLCLPDEVGKLLEPGALRS